MSTIRIATSFNIDVEFPAASFHRRLLAWAIDIVAVVFYIIIIMKGLSLAGGESASGEREDNFTALSILLVIIPAFLYHPLCEIFLKGQTVGKRIAQLKIINEYGGRPSVSQAIIRWLIRTSDNMVIVIALMAASAGPQSLQYFWSVGITFALLVTDIVLIASTRRSQRLGDILAHTMLIRTIQKAGIEETIFQQVHEDYKPLYPQVMRLSDRDINALKGILDAARKQGDYNLADRAASKIKVHLKIESSVSAFDFLETLLKDYNFLAAH
jgi:uncharacterized RDD family membrane protein YckC